MIDLHERFKEYDQVPVPELWDRIAETASTAPDAPRRKQRRLLIAVAAAAVVLLIVGGPLLLITSRDSTTLTASSVALESLEWSRIAHDEAVFGGEDGAQMASVTAGGPGYVAVGVTGDGVGDGMGARNAAVWTSPDGIAWTRVPHDEAVFGGEGDQEMVSVTAGGPGLVAVGYRFDEPDRSGVYPGVWTSVDGITWSAVPLQEEDGDMASVATGGPGLVAVGQEGWSAAVWTSPDGTTWTRVPHDPAVFGAGLVGNDLWAPQTSMRDVIVGGPGLIAVGEEGIWGGSEDGTEYESTGIAVVWTSPDGVTWTRIAHDEAVFGGEGFQKMSSVALGGTGLVAVGEFELNDTGRALVWNSADGYTWTRVPYDEAVFGPDPSLDADRPMTDVATIDSGLVAVGTGTWFSPDGSTWTRIADHLLDGFREIIVGGPGLIAVGGSETEDGRAVAAVSIASLEN
ncbi:MAG: hypothetical protein GY720_07300 [bacterium]|nr:hypothetical protein [bacterium]